MCRVEPAVLRIRRLLRHAAGIRIRSEVEPLEPEPQQPLLGTEHAERPAGLELHERRDLPIAEQHGVPERQRPDRAEAEAMRTIEIRARPVRLQVARIVLDRETGVRRVGPSAPRRAAGICRHQVLRDRIGVRRVKLIAVREALRQAGLQRVIGGAPP